MENSILKYIAGLETTGKKALRLGMATVFIWIGGLKFVSYEADGIVPFVANSPLMSFFYNHPKDYKTHMNKEGELVASNREWNRSNNTYLFSYSLGVLLISLGVSILLGRVAPLMSMIGSILIFLMVLGTLSFLITTPEAWVPQLGDGHSGFPYLSGRGRLVVKDVVILGAALITMSDSASRYLQIRKK